MPNPNNWRMHPKEQTSLFKDMLEDVGFADVVLAYESEREDGKLVLVDGHMRTGLLMDEVLPVVVLDITDEEADKLLMTLDPIGAMAEAAKDKTHALVASLEKDVAEKLKAVPNLSNILSQTPKKNPMQDQLPKRRTVICPECDHTWEI